MRGTHEAYAGDVPLLVSLVDVFVEDDADRTALLATFSSMTTHPKHRTNDRSPGVFDLAVDIRFRQGVPHTGILAPDEVFAFGDLLDVHELEIS